ncbi:MAG: uridine diphosphate-N-acetylglucosamine-binding protein YvcK [Bacillaceae bacterium]
MSGQKQKKAVIIGGGTGLSVLLRGLKKYPIDITAIVTVADDGGSSGRIRQELNIPAPGDIRNVLAALSEVEPLLEELFQHRFSTGKELTGHSMGNLLLAAMTSITGDFSHAVQELSQILNVRGRVIPSVNGNVVLHAQLDNGEIISGESKIPYSGRKIDRVFITPEKAEPLDEALKQIAEADMIILGPGSLYTSIIPNLLVEKLGEAIKVASAHKVYICNVMTQAGETLDYTAMDHLQAIHKHLGMEIIDTIVVNDEGVPKEILVRYEEEIAKPVTYNKEELEAKGLRVIHDDIIIYDDGVIRHDTNRLAAILYGLIQEQ